MLSKYSLELLPSHIWMPLSLSSFAFVLPLRNQNSSSATPSSAAAFSRHSYHKYTLRTLMTAHYRMRRLKALILNNPALGMASLESHGECKHSLTGSLCTVNRKFAWSAGRYERWNVSFRSSEKLSSRTLILCKARLCFCPSTAIFSFAGQCLTSPEDPFGCQQGEWMPQVESHLSAKLWEGACPSPILFKCSILYDIFYHL